MRPSVFPLPYTAPAISVNYATNRNHQVHTATMDEYRLFALQTHIDHLYLDPTEEFNTFMVDLGTHYQSMGQVLHGGLPIVLSETQVKTIGKFIDEFLVQPDAWIFLVEDLAVPLLVSQFETDYTLSNEGNKLYVNLANSPDFVQIHTDLAVSIYYTLQGSSPTPRVAPTAALLQPLLVSSAPLVV